MGSSLLDGAALFLLGLFVAGVYLFRSAVRRVGERPHCRRCHYDVTEQVAGGAATQRCPECGHALDAARATVVGERIVLAGRRRAGLGLMLLVLAVPIAVLVGSRDRVYPYLPDGALRFLVRHGNASDVQGAYRFLAQRCQDRRFSKAELIDVELDLHQRNLTSRTIGLSLLPNLAVLGTAVEDGSATPEQARRLAEQIADGVELRLDSQITLGARMAVRYDLRAPGPTLLEAYVRFERIESDRESFVATDLAAGGRHLGLSWVNVPFRFTQIGPHRLQFRGRVELHGASGVLVNSRVIEFERWVHVAPLVRTAPLDVLVTNAHRLMTTEVRENTLRIAFDPNTIGALDTTLAFEVFVDWGGGMRPTGSRFVRRYGQVSTCCEIEYRGGTVPRDISLLLLPTRAALGDEITTQEAWTGALLFDPIEIVPTEGEVRHGVTPKMGWQEEVHLGLLPELLDAALVRELLDENEVDLSLVE